MDSNPPKTNADVPGCGHTCTRMVDQLLPPDMLAEIDRLVDIQKLETTLMKEGVDKFADP